MNSRMKSRSNAQNRYMWGVVLDSLIQKAADNGQEITREHAKRLALQAVGHAELTIVFGIPSMEPKPTKDLTVQEFEELMEKVRAWAANMGLYIDLPNEGITYPRME